MTSRINKKYTDSYFRKKLTPQEYIVMRQKGTEPPFSGKYLYSDEKGIYCCRACGQRLFLSEYKFRSPSGWPSFRSVIKGSIKIQLDFTHFMLRDEVLCRRCGSHLGHLFYDGFASEEVRYCINSVALQFRKKN